MRVGRALLGAFLILVVGLVGAVVFAALAPGSGVRGHMMGDGMSGMAAMMDGLPSRSCSGAAQEGLSVEIRGFRFCPGTLEVKAGALVRWTNNDDAAHTVTSRGRLDSGSLAQGRSWLHRFERAGSFTYYCAIHPWMRGTVRVTA